MPPHDSDRSERRAVVLLSGGLDSATTLAWAIERGFRAHALTVDYGQRNRHEIAVARRIALALGAVGHRLARVELPAVEGSALTDGATPVPRQRSPEEIGQDIPSTYVPARNTLLLSLALGLAEVLEARVLFIGANAVDYSGYPDCRPEFLAAFERMARLATRAGVRGEPISVEAPLLRLSKSEIVREAVRLGVDLGSTVSCYEPAPDGVPCGGCDACVLRLKGFREAGIADPALPVDPRKD